MSKKFYETKTEHQNVCIDNFLFIVKCSIVNHYINLDYICYIIQGGHKLLDVIKQNN